MHAKTTSCCCLLAILTLSGLHSTNGGDHIVEDYGKAPVVEDYGKAPIPAKGVYPKMPYEDPIDYYAQANNPIAAVTAFSAENYYISDFEGFSEDANQFLLRYATPLTLGGSDWLFRATLPINHFPVPAGGTETGLGDMGLGFTYLFETNEPNVSFGVGPTFRLPTATDSVLGNEKWSGGLNAVYFNGSNSKFQYGYEISWLQSFAGDDSRNYYSVGAFRPFAFYQLGNGWYTGTAPIWIYNFQNDNYNMPIGLRLGKVIEGPNKVVNFWVEPQVSMANRGIMPDWQFWTGVKIQFW